MTCVRIETSNSDYSRYWPAIAFALDAVRVADNPVKATHKQTKTDTQPLPLLLLYAKTSVILMGTIVAMNQLQAQAIILEQC